MSEFKTEHQNVLDLIYTNEPELVIVDEAAIRLLPNQKSDKCHVPLMCMIECQPDILSSGDRNTYYCFKKADYTMIREHLESIHISNFFTAQSTNVNDMATVFYDILNDTFERFVPRAIIRSSNKPIWHDKKLSSLKNARNKEYKKLVNQRLNCTDDCTDDRTDADDIPFQEAKNNYEEYRKELHNNFIKEKASSIKTNPRSFWQFVNIKRKPNTLPSILDYDDKKASTDSEKATLFADYFQNVDNTPWMTI